MATAKTSRLCGADPETGASPYVWDRALGWYFVALVEVLEVFPKTHAGYSKLVDYFVTLASGIKDVQGYQRRMVATYGPGACWKGGKLHRVECHGHVHLRIHEGCQAGFVGEVVPGDSVQGVGSDVG